MRTHRPGTRGLTLIEIVLCFCVFLVIIPMSVFGGMKYGFWGYMSGPILLGALLLIGGLSDAICCRWVYPTPGCPTCARGVCVEKDYTPAFNESETAIEYTCKCGDTYIMKKKRFMKVPGTGNYEPFMVWKPFRGWFPDHAQE